MRARELSDRAAICARPNVGKNFFTKSKKNLTRLTSYSIVKSIVERKQQVSRCQGNTHPTIDKRRGI
jgi:hypothetical protein